MKTYNQTFDEPEFNERISNNIKGSVKVILIAWLIYLFVNWIIKGLVIFKRNGFGGTPQIIKNTPEEVIIHFNPTN